MNLYEKYALLKAQMVELENQEAELRTQILEKMVENDEDKVETPVGSFRKTLLKTWTYTDKVKELQEEFKAQKAKEESTGIATYVEKPSLRFIQIKL